MNPMIREQISAGGVAVRLDRPLPELAIVLMVPEMRWQLPKGLIDEGESPEQAALREVREEAGINCSIVSPIETIDYWFTVDRDSPPLKIHKYVHFFLMKYLSGDVADHDHEVDEARWVTLDEAMDLLEFESERTVVLKAFRSISTSDLSGKKW